MKKIRELGERLGVGPTCEAFGIPRASYYRWLEPAARGDRRHSPRALSAWERAHVLEVLRSREYVDKSPAAVYAGLLDDGMYLCSERTMYRLLSKHGEIRERRRQLQHPVYTRPELLATGPNELWSWDITRLKGPVKWTYYYLYVILDVFSRYVVGYMVAYLESSELARRLIKDTCERQGIGRDQLTVHADRGASMRSKPVALLLSDLGVTRSHSRPHVSNDNPYSESQFKTMKYRPEFPERFGSLEDARGFSVEFFRWYNTEHYHSGLGMMRPHDVHFGFADEVRDRRREVLAGAYALHPERFVRGVPEPAEVPKEVWINKPVRKVDDATTGSPRQVEIVCPGPNTEVVSEKKEEMAGAAH